MTRLAGAIAVILVALDPAAAAPARGDIRLVVARARAAVVSISTRPLVADDFGASTPRPGLGSGMIVDPGGLILTNYHVVEGSTEGIKVTLPDERTFRATLVGADPASDTAVLRIAGRGLPSLRLGDSSKLAIGETVVAIGNALWIEGGPSVTAGIVSALGRSMEQPGLPLLQHLIQTDAAINPGNSGGPLLSLRGEVVGMNTALVASAHGIGFAIAINSVKPVMRELVAKGRVVRPWLALDAVSVTASIAHANGLSAERGVYVVRVQPEGPAERAGLQANDVIVRIDTAPVKDLHAFEMALGRHRIGDIVTVSARRGGKDVTVRVQLVERP